MMRSSLAAQAVYGHCFPLSTRGECHQWLSSSFITGRHRLGRGDGWMLGRGCLEGKKLAARKSLKTAAVDKDYINNNTGAHTFGVHGYSSKKSGCLTCKHDASVDEKSQLIGHT